MPAKRLWARLALVQAGVGNIATLSNIWYGGQGGFAEAAYLDQRLEDRFEIFELSIVERINREGTLYEKP
jgi:hypothetical protein